MAKQLFGTDGIRGVANVALTPELALTIGRAAGAFVEGGEILLGWDPRLSSEMLKSAFAAGACSSGATVLEAGVIPTGTLALYVREERCRLGAMISASHNPAEDNGIKLIGPDGRKLSDETEEHIESLLATADRAGSDAIGRVLPLSGLLARHVEFLQSRIPTRLNGVRLAIDCANGAASEWAEPIFRAFGAEVTTVGCSPNGLNINAEGGATKPGTIQALMRDSHADAGLAFDGDADRVVFADENGCLINGDAAMALWALHRKHAGTLNPAVIVGTVMSNMGMERFLESEGIRLERSAVGDRYVVERMDATGAMIGGEQSGHIVFSELAPTGDGILTALAVLATLQETGTKLSSAASLFQPWPQVLVNVRVVDKDAWNTPQVQAAIGQAEVDLGSDGRLNVRSSGTQPLVRIMCEHRDRSVRDSVADSVFRATGGEIYSRVELTDALGD